MIWLMLNALSAGDKSLAHTYAWQAGLAITAAIALKQVNLVFFLSLLIAIAAVVLRDKSISFRDIISLSHKFIILPLAIYVIWRIYDVPSELSPVIDVPSGTKKSYLLRRDKEGWTIKGSWPHPYPGGK